MDVDYIDVSEITDDTVGDYVHVIAAAKNACLVYMPNLNYKGLDIAEELGRNFKIAVLSIPITLPTMDIVKQLEYSGASVSIDMIRCIENSLRNLIIELLNNNESEVRKNDVGREDEE